MYFFKILFLIIYIYIWNNLLKLKITIIISIEIENHEHVDDLSEIFKYFKNYYYVFRIIMYFLI